MGFNLAFWIAVTLGALGGLMLGFGIRKKIRAENAGVFFSQLEVNEANQRIRGALGFLALAIVFALWHQFG